MSKSLYRQFLCACVGSDARRACAVLEGSQWNWEHLFECANEEMVLPALYGSTRGRATGELIPLEVTEFLSAVESLNRERNAAIVTELEEAAALLNEAGIEPVLLKGVAYLAARVYGDPARRYLLDIDLLIPEAEIDAAADVLLQNGFAEDYTDLFADTRHHRAGLRRRGSVGIELHRSIGLGRCACLLPGREVIEKSVPWQLHGARVRMPCPEHLMTHLIVHSQVQHPYNERIWPPVRAMFDLTQLQRRFSDSMNWLSIEERFRRAHLYGVLALHLLDVRDALGLEPPAPIRLDGLTRLRRFRRQVLRRVPVLRYFDPIYMFSVLCASRLRVLRNALSTRIGWKHFLRRLLEPRIYHRFLTDFLTGRGS